MRRQCQELPRRIHALLGEILTGRKRGRRSPAEITVFDSTGLAVQDIAAAAWFFEKAREKNLGTTLTF